MPCEVYIYHIISYIISYLTSIIMNFDKLVRVQANINRQSPWWLWSYILFSVMELILIFIHTANIGIRNVEQWFCGPNKLQVLTSCSALRVSLLLRVLGKSCQQRGMWLLCAGNSRTDCLTGFLRESFCQLEFLSWRAVEVFFQPVMSSPGLRNTAQPSTFQLPCGLSHCLTSAITHTEATKLHSKAATSHETELLKKCWLNH